MLSVREAPVPGGTMGIGGPAHRHHWVTKYLRLHVLASGITIVCVRGKYLSSRAEARSAPRPKMRARPRRARDGRVGPAGASYQP